MLTRKPSLDAEHFTRLALAAIASTVLAVTIAGPALAGGLPASSPAPSASSVPTPAPVPSATPVPTFQIGGAMTGGTFNSTGLNAVGALDTKSGVDLGSRNDITNALVTPTLNMGNFRATATAGFYDLPTIGYSLNPIAQAGANTELFSAVPLYNVSYTTPNGHVSLYAGKLLTQLGQESMFTYQNFNIQRGFGWAIEPLVSHGIRGAYTNGSWTLQAEGNDGYYGGTSRAFEGSVAFAATPTQTYSFALIQPGSNSKPNPTAAVANKREEDWMYAGTFGKFVLTPYLLWVQSPSAASLGYGNETAFTGSMLGTYNFTPTYSLGFRYEYIKNASSTTDTNANADLVGYGPGSGATSFTLTPTMKSGSTLIRFEWSSVLATNVKPGLGFDANGNGSHQNRFAVEAGFTH